MNVWPPADTTDLAGALSCGLSGVLGPQPKQKAKERITMLGSRHITPPSLLSKTSNVLSLSVENPVVG
jgi:hypothetical protein